MLRVIVILLALASPAFAQVLEDKAPQGKARPPLASGEDVHGRYLELDLGQTS